MKNESKIMDHIVRLKKILEPYKKPKIILGGCASIVAVIMIFVYWPLFKKVNENANNLEYLKSELTNHNASIMAMGNMSTNSKAIKQNQIPTTIASLTKKGRSLGLVFKAISPGEIQETEQPGIGKTPINLAVESEYKTLGQFLAYLEQFPCGVVEIENISINSSKETLPRLNMDLKLKLFVEVEVQDES